METVILSLWVGSKVHLLVYQIAMIRNITPAEFFF